MIDLKKIMRNLFFEDPFERIDNVLPKVNLLRDYRYSRKIILAFSTVMIGIWFFLGFDSGVGIIEQLAKNMPDLVFGKIAFQEWIDIAYVDYGKSFHFSAFVIYGYLFCGTSYWLERELGVKRSKNMIFSFNLTLLNISVFEHWWMGSFAHFQSRLNLVEWYIQEFWFLWLYLGLLVMGFYTVFYIWVDGFILDENNKVIGRNHGFRLNKKMFMVIGVCLATILFWYFYPGYVERITIGGWTNSRLFPQTHYANTYVRNDFIHLTNVLVKMMFAFTQFYILSRLKRRWALL